MHSTLRVPEEIRSGLASDASQGAPEYRKPKQPMPRIAIFNVKYSPNLGDGIIAECLESELCRIRPDWEVVSVDLAGRQTYGSGLDAGRGTILRLLDTLPAALRQLATSTILSSLIALRYRKIWKRQLLGVDGAIIGGGQLFADTDLNFPLKLRAILQMFGRGRRPAAVFGVGVAKDMSKTARRLFLAGLGEIDLSHVAVRDNASRYNWDRHFGRAGLPKAELCSDPGLLAAETYPASATLPVRQRPLIGIGIVNPRVLDLHSGEDDDFSINAARSFWVNLANELVERGYDVSLFSNGPHDDEVFLDSILDQVSNPRVTRADRPRTPSDLAAIISSFDAIAAHRLHANILAYAFRIPHVGLSWDPKLEAFFASVGRRDFVACHTENDVGDVGAMIDRAISDGIDEEAHRKLIEKTRVAISECAAALEPALTHSARNRSSELQDAVGA